MSQSSEKNSLAQRFRVNPLLWPTKETKLSTFQCENKHCAPELHTLGILGTTIIGKDTTGFAAHFRDAGEPAVSRLQSTVAEMVRLRSRLSTDDIANRHTVIAAIHELLRAISELEQMGFPREGLKTITAPARALHTESPLIARMQEWPRGYPGDFETVEMILSGKCLSDPLTLPYYLERYVLDCPAAQQHRNKISAQAALIRSTLMENPLARILVLACGSCPDLALVGELLKHLEPELWLNDIDEGALSFSTERLSQWLPRSRLTKVHGNVITLLRRASTIPEFDLIVAGGLFDYLEERVLRFVVKNAYRKLKPGGTLFFTNIGRNNPYRPWMEYCGEWLLIERDEPSLRYACAESDIPFANVRVFQDTTRLAYLVEATKEQ